MAFAPIFQRPFSSPFDRRAAAAAVPWWLAGGVAAANAIAVYQPKGAADLAASYVNLANPGTYDAAPGTAPTFDAATGWTFNGSTQYLTTGVTNGAAWIGSPLYPKSPLGLWQSLWAGPTGSPIPSWIFLRNMTAANLLFTAVFLSARFALPRFSPKPVAATAR
jgi:hypothetical protein